MLLQNAAGMIFDTVAFLSEKTTFLIKCGVNNMLNHFRSVHFSVVSKVHSKGTVARNRLPIFYYSNKFDRFITRALIGYYWFCSRLVLASELFSQRFGIFCLCVQLVLNNRKCYYITKYCYQIVKIILIKSNRFNMLDEFSST